MMHDASSSLIFDDCQKTLSEDHRSRTAVSSGVRRLVSGYASVPRILCTGALDSAVPEQLCSPQAFQRQKTNQKKK
ncbi:hypothetical protein E1301_Tti017296 [Triplophysa tibetana]|uniref:Uncharacterized protein n=1 Tax=Triplophysa tibetana TaxID=1572043 RepID=A0A5A9P8S4_9TELE|nr:hypothetical protein E1301_Tti017296 [Triplophysa tibetana]